MKLIHQHIQSGKHISHTIVEDDVFIGSNSSLVAPVKLDKGSYTGAGSVITKNVGKGELAVGRGKQVNLKRKKSHSVRMLNYAS